MKNKFTTIKLNDKRLLIFEEENIYPNVWIKKSRLWHLYLTKEFCTAKNKRLALKI